MIHCCVHSGRKRDSLTEVDRAGRVEHVRGLQPRQHQRQLLEECGTGAPCVCLILFYVHDSFALYTWYCMRTLFWVMRSPCLLWADSSFDRFECLYHELNFCEMQIRSIVCLLHSQHARHSIRISQTPRQSSISQSIQCVLCFVRTHRPTV
jgi:hypothetical protein